MLNRLFTSRRIFVCLLAMGVTTLLGACGGGGGGDPVFPNFNYTGVQTEAVIDTTNADEFPVAMLEGSSSSGELANNIIYGASIDPEFAEGIPDPENIKKATGVISGLVKNSLTNNVNQVTGVTQSQGGSCGGSATVNATQTSTSFSGTIVFLDYCESDPVIGRLTLHGKMTINATYDSVSETLLTFSMNIQYLKMTVTIDGITETDVFAGSISVNFTTNEITMAVNFKYGGVVYKVEDYGINQRTGEIFGKLYHPSYGFVEITTTDLFEYNSTTGQYCNGTLEIVGVDSSGYVTIIEFTDADPTTTMPCTTYNICITVNDPAGATNVCSYTNDWGTAPAWPDPTSPMPPPAGT